MFENLKIGAMVYAVHNKYVSKTATNGRIQVCRIKTFENKDGKIIPILTLVGNSKQELDATVHTVYIMLTDAINAIRS